MKNSTLIILIALIFTNCKKNEINCSEKENYLEKSNIFGKVKSIKSEVFELTETAKGYFKKGKPKLISFGQRTYKEFNKNGYLTSWTNYENNSEEIKTKNVFNYNKDNVKISETIYNKKSKVIFKRIVKLENNLALNITDYNENGKIETYSLNKLNESGQIIEQTQYKNIDKKQKKYTMSYEYNNCKILKYKILDNKGELFSETDYKYKNGKIIYNSSKDKSGLNTFTIERTEIEPNKFESTRRDKSGKITYKKVIWNDKFDNLIMEIQNLKDTLENIYTFDNKNNWITMKRFKNKKPIEIVVRNIEYYK